MILVSHSLRLVALAWFAASVVALSLRGDARSVPVSAARTAGACRRARTAIRGQPYYSADMSVPAAEQQMKEAVDRCRAVRACVPRAVAVRSGAAGERDADRAVGRIGADRWGKTRGAGERIVALIKLDQLPSRVKAVIITHWHQDHVMGLGPIHRGVAECEGHLECRDARSHREREELRGISASRSRRRPRVTAFERRRSRSTRRITAPTCGIRS